MAPLQTSVVFTGGEYTTRYAYIPSTNQLLFVGIAPPGASDTDTNSTDWRIWRYTYDGSGNVLSQKISIAIAWANRATAIYT